MRRRIIVYCTALLLLSISLVVALECDTVPTCKSQGFTMSVSDCQGKAILRCPREPNNDNAVFCGGRCPTELIFDDLWDGRANTQVMYDNVLAYVENCDFATATGSGSDFDPDYNSGMGRNCVFGTGYHEWSDIDGAGSGIFYPNSDYAAQIVHDYYRVSGDDPVFGRGKWYIPAIGELVEAYGINYDDITGTSTYEGNPTSSSGATGTNRVKINTALAVINGSRVLSNALWSSTDTGERNAWKFLMSSGVRESAEREYFAYVRPFLLLQDKFEKARAPEIGEIVYSDFSHSTAAGYDSSKTPVGVVSWVSASGRSAKIIALHEFDAVQGFSRRTSGKTYGSTVMPRRLKQIKGAYQEVRNCFEADQNANLGSDCAGNLTPQQKCNRFGGQWCDEWDCIQMGGTWYPGDVEPQGTCELGSGSDIGSGSDFGSDW